MTLPEFKSSLLLPDPPNLTNLLLLALWLAAKGEWDKAHQLSQSIRTARGSWVHACLHRKEDDLANAAYRYTCTGKEVLLLRLDEEWNKIAEVLHSQI